MEKMKKYVGFDWAIKYFLRDKSHFGILEGFISVLLNENVKIVELLESESNQENAMDKYNRVDIKARNSEGHIIIIEVQLTRQMDYLKRILYGACKAITEHIRLGDDYGNVRKVYSISILYCDYGVGDDYVYRGQTIFKGIHTGGSLKVSMRENGTIIEQLPRTIFPEYYIIRLTKYDKIPENPLDEWMTYLKTGVVSEDTKVPGLSEVRKKLDYLNMTESERRSYDIYLDNIVQERDAINTAHTEGLTEGIAIGEKKGRDEGIAIGEERGREKVILEMAKNLIALGMDDEVICKTTNLSISQIAELRKQC